MMNMWQKVRTVAWREILESGLLYGAGACLLFMAWFLNWWIFGGCAAIVLAVACWKHGLLDNWIDRSRQDWFAPILMATVILPIVIGAGYVVGTHKAEKIAEYAAERSIKWSIRKSLQAERPVKPKEEKKADPSSHEYFDQKFSEIGGNLEKIRKEAEAANKIAHQAAGNAKVANDGVAEMARRLKIDFSAEEAPITLPEIGRPKREVRNAPAEPDGELKIDFDAPPRAVEEPASKKADAGFKVVPKRQPNPFKRDQVKPASPGKALKSSGIVDGGKPKTIIGSECSEGKFHPIGQFYSGPDGTLQFANANDRCRTKSGGWCTCKRWVPAGEDTDM